jgi:hypothetical protein
MRLPASTKWVLLALAGLAIAIGVAVAAANLTSQQIGIASESVSAGDVLAPSLRTPEGEGNGKQGGHEKPPGKEETPTTPAEPTSPEETTSPTEPPAEHGSDDYGGSGGGDD